MNDFNYDSWVQDISTGKVKLNGSFKCLTLSIKEANEISLYLDRIPVLINQGFITKPIPKHFPVIYLDEYEKEWSSKGITRLYWKLVNKIKYLIRNIRYFIKLTFNL